MLWGFFLVYLHLDWTVWQATVLGMDTSAGFVSYCLLEQVSVAVCA